MESPINIRYYEIEVEFPYKLWFMSESKLILEMWKVLRRFFGGDPIQKMQWLQEIFQRG